jgi:phosphoketolase
VNKLYSQMLAAKLNIFRGASPAAINSILSAADTFLATNNSADWNAMNKNAKQQVNNWASTFDQYNNGQIGPGHCD